MDNNYKAHFIQKKTCNLIELPCHYWLLISEKSTNHQNKPVFGDILQALKNFQILDNLKVKRTIRDLYKV